MICQICKEEMPFKKRDGEYYFEAVEALSKDYLPKEYEAQFLALCPVCAARYKEFVKNGESTMEKLHRALKNSDGLEVPLRLGEWETSLRFVEIHRQDMKTILRKIGQNGEINMPLTAREGLRRNRSRPAPNEQLHLATLILQELRDPRVLSWIRATLGANKIKKT